MSLMFDDVTLSFFDLANISLSLSLSLYDEMVCVQDDVEQVLQLQYFLSYVRCLITDILVSPVSIWPQPTRRTSWKLVGNPGCQPVAN